MESGERFYFMSPNLSFVSDPSQKTEAIFLRYGRKFKTDRFIICKIENKGQHKLKDVGEWYEVTIAASQII